MTVTQKSRVKNAIEEFRVGKLFMIDLAGSERAAQTKVCDWGLQVIYPVISMQILPSNVHHFI